MRFIRSYHAPKAWSPGLFVAAAILVLVFKLTGEITWWLLLGCIVVSAVVDVLVSGSTSEKDEMYITRR